MTTQHLTQSHLYIRLSGLIIQTIALVTLLTGCQSRVSDQQLKAWHQEAVAENDRLTQIQSADLSKNWRLTVQGQVNTPLTLTWPQIQASAKDSFNSLKPYPDSPSTPSNFRGISVNSLLDRAGVQAGATEVTIVASDAYYATMPLREFVRQEGLLAIEENGKPIRRTDGGPLHLVFNHGAKDQEVKAVRNEWVYYVTHLIIGTEPLRLKVGNAKTLNRFDLEKLPRHTMTTFVGYKIGWSAEPVKLVGVKLKDVLDSLNLQLPTNALIKVHRKAMIPKEAQKTVVLSADILKSCDVMLAYGWGPEAQNIPASKGGPLTLAYGKNCTSDAVKNLAWLPFVESITVEPEVKP
ncbi:MAG: molybdopterin-dependent oxidoreductase [Alkalinema sp. RU_4_3]|nr:molybdopterin-dependent oxidoreductase [Alkalinema sp. RU_4_3]